MKRAWGILALLLLLGACASKHATKEKISQELDAAVAANSAKSETAASQALLPPLQAVSSPAKAKRAEVRFDLTVNNTPAAEVFMAIVSGTRYSMLVHPEVTGTMSLNLKDVTVFEALEAIREMYGYDYRVEGTRIYIQPLTMQTRIFQVSYLAGQREGKSSLRVASGSVADNAVGTTPGAPAVAAAAASARDSSKVTMSSNTDFWEELTRALTAIVGTEGGRSVVVSPMSGVIVVRAMPDELRNVAAYLRATRLSIGRQVILEAKIMEVSLHDGFQSGVNWGKFLTNPGRSLSGGVITPGTTLGTTGALTNGTLTATPGSTLALSQATAGGLAGGIFGLALQTSNFAALLSFLETQGDVHVLSSPRIATLNNQKAVLKVGTDEFFVTGVNGGTQGTTSTQGTGASINVQPFFSGISLDVTPRIDENNEVILHIHPSVSTVSQVSKKVDLGTTGGTFNLPLASSSVSETDSIVRARDGQIIAIGGLMRTASQSQQSGLPLLPKSLFGQTEKTTEKRELVILLKPTVVDSDEDWSDVLSRSRQHIGEMSR